MVSSKVLIVDDDPFIANLVRHKLQKADIEADSSTSAADALARMEQNNYAIVLLDIHMPGMSGVDAISKFKKRCPLVQIIMLTGDVSVSNVIECVDRGAIDFFSKIENIDALPEAVHCVLKKTSRWMGLLSLARRTKPEPVDTTTV